MNDEFQRGDAVTLRIYGREARGEVCALLGARASVRITEARHFPRLVGTSWCIYRRRLMRVLDSGDLFAEPNGDDHTGDAPTTKRELWAST